MIFCSLIIYLGIAVLLFGFWPLFSAILAKALYYCIFAMNYGIRFIDSLPGSVTNGIVLSFFAIIFIYLIIFFFSQYLLHIKRKSLLFALFFLLALSSLEVYQRYQNLNQQSITFFYMPNHFVVDIVNGESAVQIADPILRNENQKLDYVLKEYRLQNNYFDNITKIFFDEMQPENHFFLDSALWIGGNQFQFLNKKFAFFNPELSKFSYDNKLEIDFLIVQGDVFDSVAELLKIYQPKSLIISTSVPSYVGKRMEKDCDFNNLACQNIWRDGAICF